jgi:hypothetical protein
VAAHWNAFTVDVPAIQSLLCGWSTSVSVGEVQAIVAGATTSAARMEVYEILRIVISS